MVLKHWINYVREKSLAFNLTLYTRTNFIWIIKLNVTNKTAVRKLCMGTYI